MKFELFVVLCAVLRVGFGQSQCPNYDVLDVQLNEDDINELVDKHNEYRQMVANGQVEGQPAAAEMPLMTWDVQLADKAQKWADNCVYEHDPNRVESRFNVGQNLAIMWTSDLTDTSKWNAGAVELWFNEHFQYTYGPIDDISETGHYTQLVWADSIYLGCGIKYYSDGNQLNQFYVCNYGPAGNYDGEYPYEAV